MWFQNPGAPSTAKYSCVFGKLSDPNVTWFLFYHHLMLLYFWESINDSVLTPQNVYIDYSSWGDRTVFFPLLKIMRSVGSSANCSGKIFIC